MQRDIKMKKKKRGATIVHPSQKDHLNAIEITIKDTVIVILEMIHWNKNLIIALNF